jgi:hypothetical protein
MYAEKLAAGKTPRVGARCVWEHLRWMTEIDTTNTYGENFKLNDHFVSRYARKLADFDQRFLSAFEFRKQRQ